MLLWRMLILRWAGWIPFCLKNVSKSEERPLSIHSLLKVSGYFDEASLSYMISVCCSVAWLVMMSSNNDKFKEQATWNKWKWVREQSNSSTGRVEAGASQNEQTEEKVEQWESWPLSTETM